MIICVFLDIQFYFYFYVLSFVILWHLKIYTALQNKQLLGNFDDCPYLVTLDWWTNSNNTTKRSIASPPFFRAKVYCLLYSSNNLNWCLNLVFLELESQFRQHDETTRRISQTFCCPTVAENVLICLVFSSSSGFPDYPAFYIPAVQNAGCQI